MKQVLFVVCFLFTILESVSQSDNGPNFFYAHGDTIAIFFNSTGSVVPSDQALYYRKAVLEGEGLFFSGQVIDYSLDGQKVYECMYTRSGINGKVTSYYPNGTIRYSGFYKDSERDSTWIFYYENEQIEKVIEISDNEPFFKEYYKENGALVFDDGNGRYSGKIKNKGFEVVEYSISGRIVDGKMHGNWSWRNAGARGSTRFKRGEAVGIKDYGFPMPEIPKIFGYDLHEEMDIFQFIAIPQAIIESRLGIYGLGVPVELSSPSIETIVNFQSDPFNKSLQYKLSPELNLEFVSDFRLFIESFSSRNRVEQFWSFIQFSINPQNSVEGLQVFSNSEKIEAAILNYLSENENFQAPKVNNESVSCDVFLCVLLENNRIYFPGYNYSATLIIN